METKIKEFTETLTHRFEFKFNFTKLRKYYRITMQIGNSTSAYAFVDMEGNIYLPSSWKSPAKHIRGHISEPFKNGCCEKYGIKYLK